MVDKIALISLRALWFSPLTYGYSVEFCNIQCWKGTCSYNPPTKKKFNGMKMLLKMYGIVHFIF